MKRRAATEDSHSTSKKARHRHQLLPDEPKKKRVCFRCKEEGHFISHCVKVLKEAKPRCRIDLGESIFLAVFPSKREPTIHLRHYGESDDKPTQDGVVLTLSRWKELERLVPDIDRAVNTYDDPDEDLSFRQHLGGNWYVSVTSGYPCVDVRRFWQPKDSTDLKATRDGIALKFDQWEKLMDAFDDVTSFVPELTDVIRCIDREDHMNQLGAMKCSECNPNDFMNW